MNTLLANRKYSSFHVQSPRGCQRFRFDPEPSTKAVWNSSSPLELYSVRNGLFPI